jgi:hypothetical protein
VGKPAMMQELIDEIFQDVQESSQDQGTQPE